VETNPTASPVSKWRKRSSIPDIREEALLIEVDEILAEKQAAPPEGLSDVDEALGHAKSSALFFRILHSLSHKVNKIISKIDMKSPTQLWDKLQTEFGIPLVKERATLIKELCELKMGSNISEYISKHRTLTRKLRDIGTIFNYCWGFPWTWNARWRFDTKDAQHQMRTLLDFLVGHFFLVCGEQRRVAELADMFVM
jgi:gag-polypeptide of LTR copia-type